MPRREEFAIGMGRSVDLAQSKCAKHVVMKDVPAMPKEEVFVGIMAQS